MLLQSAAFVFRRPSVLFTLVTCLFIYVFVYSEDHLNISGNKFMSKGTNRLLFRMGRKQNSQAGFKPIRRSDLQWDRPVSGISLAARHWVKIQKAAGVGHNELQQSELDGFWRAIYERELFHWLTPNSKLPVEYDPGTVSYVITGGALTFQRVVFLIRSLNALECTKNTLVEVYHCKEDPFEDAMIAFLEKEFNIKPVLLNDLFGPSSLSNASKDEKINITTETAKVYAALASRAERVVLVNHDVILFACPDVHYPKGKTVFFKDRLLHPKNGALTSFIIDRVTPQPVSSQLARSAVFQELSSFQQDSSLVIVDKRDYQWVGLYISAGLMSRQVREKWGGNFRGDKEAFWMGWEVAGLEYDFERTNPGAIGFQHEQEQEQAVCGGKLLHYSDVNTDTPVWASGGVDRSEADGPRFDTLDWVSLTSGKWTMGLCQIGVGEVSDELKKTIGLLKSIYKNDPLV